jgi:hypothetical protein
MLYETQSYLFSNTSTEPYFSVLPINHPPLLNFFHHINEVLLPIIGALLKVLPVVG